MGTKAETARRLRSLIADMKKMISQKQAEVAKMERDLKRLEADSENT